jgi:hypothetical protein
LRPHQAARLNGNQKGHLSVTATDESEIQQVLQPAVDLLCSMPAEGRNAWIDWFVDRIADSERLTPQQGTQFLVALYLHLLNRVSEEADYPD